MRIGPELPQPSSVVVRQVLQVLAGLGSGGRSPRDRRGRQGGITLISSRVAVDAPLCSGTSVPCVVYTGSVDLADASAIFTRYADRFVVAYVFGSVAAGTADEHSDIDVIVVRHTTQPFFDRLREIMDLRLEFGAADMLIYTPAELEQMLAEDDRYFIKQAVRTGYRIEGTQQRGRSLAQTSRE